MRAKWRDRKSLSRRNGKFFPKSRQARRQCNRHRRFSASPCSHAKIEKRSGEGAEIAVKSLSNKASRHIACGLVHRKGLKTSLTRANQYKSTSDIVVQNVEKPVFLGSFRHIVPLPESNGANMATQMSKSQLIEKIATSTEVSKKEVKGVMDALVDVGHKELKKNGVFLVPGFAKFVVVKKPATKARKGTNPFTGEEMMFKAKPARKIVRARPVKAAKDAV